MLSGERTKAMLPSRGGRLMVTPAFISRSQVVVDVVDLVGEVAEIARLAVVLGVPVVGELDQRRIAAGRCLAVLDRAASSGAARNTSV